MNFISIYFKQIDIFIKSCFYVNSYKNVIILGTLFWLLTVTGTGTKLDFTFNGFEYQISRWSTQIRS